MSDPIEQIKDGNNVIHFIRHGYEAYVRDPGGLGFEVLHQNHSDYRWRKAHISPDRLRAELERLEWEVVDGENTPFVDSSMSVTRDNL